MLDTLSVVKNRLGIYYSDANKDDEVLQLMNAASQYCLNAGWDFGSTPSALAVEAMVIYCKMALSSDPAAMVNNPFLIALIAQGRNEVVE